jgi:hypothetical protein
MKLIEVVHEVSRLTAGAPYAVIGGLAQILWARKSHTDDLDVALEGDVLHAALDSVRSGRGGVAWSLPSPPDKPIEADDVIEVAHLLHDGAVVDLLTFRDAELNAEIVSTAQRIPELGDIRFIRPELLLVTHLLRPGPLGALAAVELVLARHTAGAFAIDETRKWAVRLEREARLDQILAQAATFQLI